MIMGGSPAVALTVAVFFMGITRSEWVELWAGVLGAIPASVIAALVAMWVLGRSNEHQQKIATDAAKDQKRLAEVQLEDQRRLGAEQLAEQRNEAALVRERAAIADVIATAGGLLVATWPNSEVLAREWPVIGNAITRWRLELGLGDMSEEIKKWDTILYGAASNHFIELSKGDLGEKAKSFEILNDLVANVSTAALHWQDLEESERSLVVKQLANTRRSHGAVLEEMIGVTFRQ